MNNPVYLDAEKRRGVFDEIAETTAIYNAFVEEGGTFHYAGDQFSRSLSRAELVAKHLGASLRTVVRFRAPPPPKEFCFQSDLYKAASELKGTLKYEGLILKHSDYQNLTFADGTTATYTHPTGWDTHYHETLAHLVNLFRGLAELNNELIDKYEDALGPSGRAARSALAAELTLSTRAPMDAD